MDAVESNILPKSSPEGETSRQLEVQQTIMPLKGDHHYRSTVYKDSGSVPPLNLSTGRQLLHIFEEFRPSPSTNAAGVLTDSGVGQMNHENDNFHFSPGTSGLHLPFNCNAMIAKPDRVFVWDLDETTIILNSLLNGDYAKKFAKDVSSCVSLGLTMEKLVNELAEKKFFFADLEDFNQANLDDTNSDEFSFSVDGLLSTAFTASELPSTEAICFQRQDRTEKLVHEFRQIREQFTANRTNVGVLLGSEKKQSWLRLRSEIEALTDHWTSLIVKTLAMIGARSSCSNVLVSTDPLIPTISKVLLFGLGTAFQIENIYSSTTIGKEVCFKRILSRFGEKCTYVVIGHRHDDESAAKQMCWPFWRISSHTDIAALYSALDLGYL